MPKTGKSENDEIFKPAVLKKTSNLLLVIAVAVAKTFRNEIASY